MATTPHGLVQRDRDPRPTCLVSLLLGIFPAGRNTNLLSPPFGHIPSLLDQGVTTEQEAQVEYMGL